MIAHDAVDLLRHGHVERAQPRLDVYDGNMQLGGSQGTGQRGICVAEKHHGIERFVYEHILDARHHARRLCPVPAGADVQIVVRGRYAQFLEENGGHVGIVVLTRVQYFLFHPVGKTSPYGSR